MSWKPSTQSDKCPKCSKSVYANEAKLAAGQKWHIMCFKCSSCNKLLESTTQADHEGTLFCKSCHGRQFGTKGYGYGGGAGVLSMDTGASVTGQSSRSADISSSNDSSKPTWSAVSGNGAAPKVGGSGAVVEGGCSRCGKRVYEAEKKIAVGREWHKSCFNCVNCHKSLDSTSLNDKDGEIYCKGCYGKLFGPKGVGYGLGAGTLQM